MKANKIHLSFLLLLFLSAGATGQSVQFQQGLLFKSGTAIRLGSIRILNKRTLAKASSNTIGIFSIPAVAGDTLEFSGNNYQSTEFVVTDFADKVVYLSPAIELDEVVVKENSIINDFREVQRGYREKSVFYTGTPHYYYLFLKPMTFIYENFKSEVKDARRFNRYARRELASMKVTARFNNASIRAAVQIKDTEIEDFKSIYTPTVIQIDAMNDYDLINYIKTCYKEFKKRVSRGTQI